VPVPGAVKSVGRVEEREIPSLKVVQTVHQGFRAPLYRPAGGSLTRALRRNAISTAKLSGNELGLSVRTNERYFLQRPRASRSRSLPVFLGSPKTERCTPSRMIPLISGAALSVDKMPVMLRWQRLETEGGPRSVLRAKVPGGWLIWCDDYSSSESGYSGLTFMPDPKHEWDGRSL
jgi:hypothetical protein